MDENGKLKIEVRVTVDSFSNRWVMKFDAKH